MSFEYDAEKTCSVCDGDGQIEYDLGGYDYYGSPRTDHRKCGACDGRGTYTVHMRPIDFEDLAKIEGEDDDPYRAFAYRGGNP